MGDKTGQNVVAAVQAVNKFQGVKMQLAGKMGLGHLMGEDLGKGEFFFYGPGQYAVRGRRIASDRFRRGAPYDPRGVV